MFFVILFFTFINLQLMACDLLLEEVVEDFETTSATNSTGNAAVDDIILPWGVTKHIEELAKQYAQHCEQNTKVNISRNYGLGPLLGFLKSHRHKNKTTQKTLAWIAAERDKTAALLNDQVAESEDYKTNLMIHDETEEIKRNNSYISAELEEDILQRELSFMEWRSRVMLPDVAAIRAYSAALEVQIAEKKKLLKILTSFHANRLFISEEGTIDFVLKNVAKQHKEFFAANKEKIEQYVKDTYYPE